MNNEEMIKELRELRDEAQCTDNHCLCERYDRIIDALESNGKAVHELIAKVSNPDASDGEGLAKIPQDVHDEYMSDGECVDEMLDIFNTIYAEATDLKKEEIAKILAVDVNKWAGNATAVARFGYGASSGERASYHGLPMVYDALTELSALDPYHRAAVANFVTDWANGSTNKLWATLQEMYRAHDLELSRKEKEQR